MCICIYIYISSIKIFPQHTNSNYLNMTTHQYAVSNKYFKNNATAQRVQFKYMTKMSKGNQGQLLCATVLSNYGQHHSVHLIISCTDTCVVNNISECSSFCQLNVCNLLHGRKQTAVKLNQQAIIKSIETFPMEALRRKFKATVLKNKSKY